MKVMRFLTLTAIGIGMCAAGAQAADGYPNKVITIVVPFGAGSPTDVVGRQAAQAISEGLGQQVIVENKAGASGVIGTRAVSAAASDGYTLLIITNSTHAANLTLFKSLPYHPVKDFTPISNLNISPMLLLAHPSVPAKSVADLVAYGKAHPRELKIGDSGSSTRVASAKLMKLAGFEGIRVPYDSIPPSLTAVIGGQISLTFADFGTGLPQLKAGTVKALAVTSIKRSTLTPDVPTLDEAGLKGFDVAGWQGIAAPAGTDPAIVEKIFRAIKDRYDTPAVRERFAGLGMQVDTSDSPAAYAKFIATETDRWGEMVRAAGIQPQ